MSITCKKCGTVNQDDSAVICPSCGVVYAKAEGISAYKKTNQNSARDDFMHAHGKKITTIAVVIGLAAIGWLLVSWLTSSPTASTDNSLLIGFLATFVVFGSIGMLIGQYKGRVLAGLFFSMLLGPIGWLIIALGPNMKGK
jgi:ribosomal protein L37E